jgi:DNA-binding MarR family transcriptional regulator
MTRNTIVLPCACASLRRAARAVTSAYTLEMRGTGLNPTKFTLLWMLDRNGPSTQKTLAELLAIDSATLTRTLAPLARRGWIRAERGEDRRQIRWEITPTGLRRMVAGSHAWKRAQQRVRDRVGSDRLARLLNDLAVITGAAHADDPASV